MTTPDRIRYHARKAAHYAASGNPALIAWARWHQSEMQRLKGERVGV